MLKRQNAWTKGWQEDRRETQDPQDGGFSFTEVLVTIMLIAILSLVAVPVFTKVIDGAKDRADQSTVSAVQSAYDSAQIFESTSDLSAAKDYDSLVSTLQSLDYLKSDGSVQYEPQNTDKVFAFDPSTGVVSVQDKT